LCFISGQKAKRVSASELVSDLKMPRPFLRKILQVLNKKGILRSSKGQGGGFLLAKPANKIFLLDLIEIFQGPLNLNDCFFKKMPCADARTCILRKKIGYIEKYVVSQLKSINISSLIRG
jgi:Rrf2 family cysteine metabolism transcriptional repressor